MDELSLPEAARRTGVNYDWIYRHLTAGTLPGRRLPNGRWRLRADLLPTIVERHEVAHLHHLGYTAERPRPTCGLDGCDRPAAYRVLCKRHYNKRWLQSRRDAS
jgi:hypothetical protein